MSRALLVTVLALVGCSQGHPPQPSANGIAVSNGDGQAEIQVVTLRDGTRCAVLIGYRKGAISCDWRRGVE